MEHFIHLLSNPPSITQSPDMIGGNITVKSRVTFLLILQLLVTVVFCFFFYPDKQTALKNFTTIIACQKIAVTFMITSIILLYGFPRIRTNLNWATILLIAISIAQSYLISTWLFLQELKSVLYGVLITTGIVLGDLIYSKYNARNWVFGYSLTAIRWGWLLYVNKFIQEEESSYGCMLVGAVFIGWIYEYFPDSLNKETIKEDCVLMSLNFYFKIITFFEFAVIVMGKKGGEKEEPRERRMDVGRMNDVIM